MSTYLTAPLRLDVQELARLLGRGDARALESRSMHWRRWRGAGEPVGGVRVQTPRWSAHYVPVVPDALEVTP